jgi:hypothetical protein
MKCLMCCDTDPMGRSESIPSFDDGDDDDDDDDLMLYHIISYHVSSFGLESADDKQRGGR